VKHLLFVLFVGFPLVMACSAAPKPADGFDASLIDKSIDPCTDFYQYSCGGWLKAHPLPSDQSSFGRFEELYERNTLVLKDILEQASQPTAQRTPVQQKIGDLYHACMDEAAANRNGIAPLKPDLAAIDQLNSKKDLASLLAMRHQRGIAGFFNFSSQQDAKDSSKVIGAFFQGGLGLPSKDYYLDQTDNAKQIREKYLAHMEKMFALAGETPEQAKADAAVVMNIETTLAHGSLNKEARRDPKRVYNPKSLSELQALAPGFNFRRYLSRVGAPSLKLVNAAEPAYFEQMQAVLNTQSLPAIKAYLRWHLIRTNAGLLSDDFVQENFNFNGRVLAGAKELKPRWRRCVSVADNNIGEGVGMAFVERTFGSEGKERMLTMVKNLEKALEDDITQLDWMTADTRKEALSKLKAIENKIGYPEHPRDYASVVIKPDDLVGDVAQLSSYESHRDLNKIGKPVDKSDWELTPSEVNAYFNPYQNNVNFPAGILQPPFFSRDIDDAVNYGAIGVIIGHELTHGFDDEGRQFDLKGSLQDWWTPADSKAFDERASCVVKQYEQYYPVPDLHINGKLTLGENVADNGGIRIAYNAWQNLSKDDPGGQKPIDGFTPDQRFFLGAAQAWCTNSSDEFLRLITKTDEHSVEEFRVKGMISNMPEFRKAFGCKTGQPMAPVNACRVW
jgi:putative endopeptidase